ncbi:hypothetical protein H261_20622 [Paramagnetospirillum caucaseum]|uniref:Uncharacterized protein n=1 Tax=Paramagnetospirillum caucaseum TaxID=1244869 RepID=M3A5B2_9PROT|nr:hypothetical protein [Paramagnetospirillum caucaseum]EME68023.1 hypothetical protein H261_20622 [Paramagnetospirillum caucaseum]
MDRNIMSILTSAAEAIEIRRAEIAQHLRTRRVLWKKKLRRVNGDGVTFPRFIFNIFEAELEITWSYDWAYIGCKGNFVPERIHIDRGNRLRYPQYEFFYATDDLWPVIYNIELEAKAIRAEVRTLNKLKKHLKACLAAQ